jgi:hypothetical protein
LFIRLNQTVFRHRPTGIPRGLPAALLALPLALSACVSHEEQVTTGKQRYLAAKAACVAAYRTSLVWQSDCRSNAANQYVRPWYRYPDLMNDLQGKRRVWAMQVDAGKMTRAQFDRLVARAERASDREEARRNRAMSVASRREPYDD